jgi:hypothetical protein
MHSSGFILGIANRYHGYIASPLSGNGTEFREICYTGSPLQYNWVSYPKKVNTSGNKGKFKSKVKQKKRKVK